MFTIIPRSAVYIDRLIGLKLTTAMPIHESTGSFTMKKEWQCETEDGTYVLIKYESGVLNVSISEYECELRYNLRPVATSNSFLIDKIDFTQIKNFFEFQIKEENFLE